jgi:LEA14-like dessication related protein
MSLVTDRTAQPAFSEHPRRSRAERRGHRRYGLRYPALSFLLAVAGALGGCAALGNTLEEPGVRLERVIVRDVGVRGGSLDLMVEVDNPNGFDLRGTEVELGFDVEGSHVGDVRYDDDFSVDRGGSTTLTLPMRFEWAGVGSALRTALSYGEIPYRMKGQIRLQTPWGAHSVPFTREGRAPLHRVGGALSVPSSR